MKDATIAIRVEACVDAGEVIDHQEWSCCELIAYVREIAWFKVRAMRRRGGYARQLTGILTSGQSFRAAMVELIGPGDARICVGNALVTSLRICIAANRAAVLRHRIIAGSVARPQDASLAGDELVRGANCRFGDVGGPWEPASDGQAECGNHRRAMRVPICEE
jgi:hypothetical protein